MRGARPVSSNPSRVKILFFAQLREVAGVAEAELDAGDVDGTCLRRLLLGRWPALAPMLADARLARNGEYAAEGEVFRAADEVALIPPVSGG